MREVVLDTRHRLRWRRPYQVGQHRMYLDEIDTLRLARDPFGEPTQTSVFEQLVQPGDVVVDVGANIGYFTLMFARMVGPHGRVYAFEPDATNFALLARNVALNGYQNVRLEQRALSDRSGQVLLYLSTVNFGDHRIVRAGDDRASVPVEAVRLDDYLGEYDGRLDLIKMDIQGAEVMALRGMTATLTQHPNASIVLEYWPKGLQQAGSSADELLSILEQHGCSLQEIDEEAHEVRPADPARLRATVAVAEGRHTNLLCRRTDGLTESISS